MCMQIFVEIALFYPFPSLVTHYSKAHPNVPLIPSPSPVCYVLNDVFDALISIISCIFDSYSIVSFFRQAHWSNTSHPILYDNRDIGLNKLLK
jgi:hypothetical protein